MDALTTYLKAKRGRLTELAKAIHVTPGAITQWEKVPAERVVQIEHATGVPRQELRPDLYEGWNEIPHPTKTKQASEQS